MPRLFNSYDCDTLVNILTVQDHWNAEKARDARADQPHAAGPSTSHWSPIHHEYGDDVGGNL